MLKKLNIVKNISMSQNHSKVNDGWSEWQDNNSPIHNEAICPLFYTTKGGENQKTIDSDGNYYEIKDGALYKNDTYITDIDNHKFKQSILDYHGELCEWWNGHLYYGVRNDDQVDIYEDGVKIKTVATRTNPLCERLWHAQYFAIFQRESQYDFQGWDSKITTNIGLYGDISNIKIFISYIYDDHLQRDYDFVCVAPNSGADLDVTNVKPIFFVRDMRDIVTKYDNITLTGTTSIPSVILNYLIRTTFTVSKLNSSTSKTCYLQDGVYYDNDSGNALTFDDGYVPVHTTDNYYRYMLFTTEYTYTGVVSNDSVNNVNVKMNVTVPGVTSFEWNYNVGAAQTNTRTLTFASNFGAVNVETPTVKMTCKADEWTISQLEIENGTQNIKSFYEDVPGSESVAVAARGDKFIMLDDGVFYNLIAPQATSNWGTYCGFSLDAKFDDIVNSVIRLTVNKSFSFNSSYATYVNTRYSYGYGDYFRAAFSMQDSETASWKDKDHSWNVGYDKYFDHAMLDCGLRGVDDNFDIPYGSRENKINDWTLLLNDGYISGISYNGILVAPWNKVDSETPITKDDAHILYRDVDTNNWIMISIEDGNEIQQIEGRYIVVNTTSRYNCYDTYSNTVQRYASDYNMRLWYGWRYSSWSHDAANNSNLVVGSAINAEYDVSGNMNGVASAAFPAVLAYNVAYYGSYNPSERPLVPTTFDMNGVDIYEMASDKAVAPTYYYTIGSVNDYRPRYYKNKLFVGGKYQLYTSNVGINRNPSIFATYVYSGNSEDYFIDGKWGYKMTYNNIDPVLIAQRDERNAINSLNSIFVIQSLPYAVIDGKIYALSYIDGSYQGRECIIDTKSMIFIGNTPIRAYFYSPNNRGIYAFTGNANLSKLRDASAISEIYKSWYNPATQTIFFSTNDGLYMLNEETSYKQLFYDVKDVIFLKDGSTAIIDGTTLYRLYYEDGEGRTTNQVRLNTGLYGAGDNNVFTIKKWYFSLFSDQRRNGKFKIKSFILRDDGKVEEQLWSKEVKSTDWDKDFNSLQISYAPANNRGVGVGVDILSDFAISDITVDADIQNTANKSSAKFKL